MKLQSFFSAPLKHSSLILLESNEESLEQWKNEILQLQLDSKISTYHPRRLVDFKLGRLCAHLAHREARKSPLLSLPIGEKREPCWPEEVVGSISHGAGHVCAVVASESKNIILGIDLEEWGRVKSELAKTILGPREKEQLDLEVKNPLSENELLTLIFSAKEALYKALYPQVKKFFGFEAAQMKRIEFSKTSGLGHFEIELLQDLGAGFGPTARNRFAGHFRLNKEILFTVIETQLSD